VVSRDEDHGLGIATLIAFFSFKVVRRRGIVVN
jgi:hypothetical protein